MTTVATTQRDHGWDKDGVVWRRVGLGVIVLVGLYLVIAPAFGGSTTFDVAVAGFGFVVCASLGGLIVVKKDGHGIGWILLLTGLAVVFANGFHLVPGISQAVGAWVASWSWTLVFALFALLALTFPSGRLPSGVDVSSRLGRMAIWVLPAFVMMGALTENLGGPEASSGERSPVGFLPDSLAMVAPIATFLVLVGASVSLVTRRRRAVVVERAQLTWVVFGLVLLVGAIGLTFALIFVSIVTGAGDPGDEVWTVAFAMMVLFPVSFAVAVLRYRLFDIERIISRTVTYVLVVGGLALVFAAVVAGIPQLLRLPGESPLLVATATLAAAALFNPLRKRVQTGVDRRFNRSRYDAQLVVDRLSGRLRRNVGADDVIGEMRAVVAGTMQPRSLSVWVRRRPE